MSYQKSIPNWLTWGRIAAIPLIVLCMYGKSPFAHQLAALLFLLASVTDFLDGHLARLWNVQSSIGRFLDPIADKLLVAAVIVMLVRAEDAHIVPAITILCREILVSGLREFLAQVNVSVPVSRLAKVKTAIQMIALLLLILGNEGSDLQYMQAVGNMALWVASIFTVVTGYAYLKAGAKHIV